MCNYLKSLRDTESIAYFFYQFDPRNVQLPKISQGYRLLFQFSEAIKFIHDYVAKSITNWGVTFAFTKKKIWNDIAKKKKKKKTQKQPKS